MAGQQPPDFIPDSQFVSDEDKVQQKYGTLPQQSMAAIESLGRGLTFGLSDDALMLSGVNPEDIKARREANPAIATVGNIVGGARTLGLAPVGAAAEAGLAGAGVGPIASRAIGYGAEGALVGAGNLISDQALGDPNLNAQKVLAELGMGAALGSGLGLLSKGLEAGPSLFRKSAPAEPESLDDINGGPPGGPGAPSAGVVDAPEFKPSTGINPTSLDEIRARNKLALARGEQVDLPAKAVLEDALSRVQMRNPIHRVQVDSLSDQATRDLYKIGLEMPGADGDDLRTLEALQKNELVEKTGEAIKELAPDAKLTSDAVDGGNRASEIFTDQYQKEKKSMGPAFQALKGTELDGINNLPGVIDKMTKEVPGVARMFDTTEELGTIKPYKTSWGIDKATYNAVKEAVESLKSGAPTFEELSNVRKGLDQHIDIMAQGQAPREIRALKKAMMDHMQEVLEKVDPLIQVASEEGNEGVSLRGLHKQYAINEQQREVIEKAFGASVGSPEFGAISKIKPEVISDRIFANTATTQAAKNILPPEKFNEILGNWLSEQVEKVTQDGYFSSKKFGSFLKKNQDALNVAFADNPEALTKLKDYSTIARILPDSASINPSGTAKTALGILNAHSIGEFISNIKGYAGEKIQNAIVTDEINSRLAGRADQATKLSILKRTIEKTTNRMDSAAKAVFSNEGRGAVLKGLMDISDQEIQKRMDRVNKLSTDPSAMMDHMGKSTEALYAAAPNITQHIHTTMAQSLNFLASKLPSEKSSFPLSDHFKISDAQKDEFNQNYEIVNDPLVALDLVKNGTLTGLAMTALKTTHPDLLNEMQSHLISHFDPEKAKDLDYSVKISLAKFLGQPLDENMTGLAAASYQAALASPAPTNGQAKQSRTTLGGLKELDLSNRSLTRSQVLQKNEES